jgi:hypothetical protein
MKNKCEIITLISSCNRLLFIALLSYCQGIKRQDLRTGTDQYKKVTGKEINKWIG